MDEEQYLNLLCLLMFGSLTVGKVGREGNGPPSVVID